MGHPFGCVGCTSKQPLPIRMGSLNPIPRVMSLSCSLQIMNLWNNTLKGLVARTNVCLYPIIFSFYSDNLTFLDFLYYMYLFYGTFLLYVVLIWPYPVFAWNTCHWTYSNQQSTNTRNKLAIESLMTMIQLITLYYQGCHCWHLPKGTFTSWYWFIFMLSFDISCCAF